MGTMPFSRSVVALVLLGLVGCDLIYSPTGQGPQWLERSVDALVAKLGKPDREVRLPLPSLSTVYIYGLGNAPGNAICEHDYYIRGATVIGYSEHGVAADCHRVGGRTE
jgi:hypothetical protein